MFFLAQPPVNWKNVQASPTFVHGIDQPIDVKLVHPGRCVFMSSNALDKNHGSQASGASRMDDEQKHDNLHVGICMRHTMGSNTFSSVCQLWRC